MLKYFPQSIFQVIFVRHVRLSCNLFYRPKMPASKVFKVFVVNAAESVIGSKFSPQAHTHTYVRYSVTRLGDLLDFGQFFKAFDNN